MSSWNASVGSKVGAWTSRPVTNLPGNEFAGKSRKRLGFPEPEREKVKQLMGSSLKVSGLGLDMYGRQTRDLWYKLVSLLVPIVQFYLNSRGTCQLPALFCRHCGRYKHESKPVLWPQVVYYLGVTNTCNPRERIISTKRVQSILRKLTISWDSPCRGFPWSRRLAGGGGR